MATALHIPAAPMDLRTLHQRMGRVYHQPVRVHSFTNKRFTVNFRVPLEDLRRILPEPIEPDEIGSTGLGMLSMCACDFWVSRMGWVPIPPVRNNDMLCRISAKIRKAGQEYRAYYTLRSDSSSKFLGFFGRRFSHFRKQVSEFTRIDNGKVYSLECRADDPLCRGMLSAEMASVTKEKPPTTIFADVTEAKEFVFDLDGSCGYNYDRGMLSFQKIDYPPWDMYFCHQARYEFPLIDYLVETYGLRAEARLPPLHEGDGAGLGDVLDVSTREGPVTIWTVGYGKWPVKSRAERLVAALKANGITRVVDTRLNPCASDPTPGRPYGPKPWNLQEGRNGIVGLLNDAGIAYEWIAELGNPQRQDPEMTILRSHLADAEGGWPVHRGLDRLAGIVSRADQRVALLCACDDPAKCHRTVIALALADGDLGRPMEVREI